ncbi:MAG TPA: polysaccharide deacetylase family protein [Methylomusa anaerophila]|uniref:Polysaccharide deacetylase n=1 Tax=Methylomusa anaerophila TaxID=1930071 RepID=A0A348AGC8_9FIRM|nr:polysaccharide deacetylase family protein [Methylomusa anaerophila]BBB90126.1 polysaccharide deacetylase [Methylomusa anaerophila]HML88150.1 polysaccharide deacetylase family protein [Methylomusa anaerophila]
MKNFLLTLDLEEWRHLDYLKPYADKMGHGRNYIRAVIPFTENVAARGIRMTVFVVGEIAGEHRNIIRQLSQQGHEIACHSHTHGVIHEMTDTKFRQETLQAKQILEDIVAKPVVGYRAPFFSMDNHKLAILWDCGFQYDASFIRLKGPKPDNVLDMSGYRQIESLVFEKDGCVEFEIPTLDIMGKTIPISSCGYFRLFPPPIMEYLMKKYYRHEDNFIFYVHPFELTDEPLDGLKVAGWKNAFRFQTGRKGNSKRLLKFLSAMQDRGFGFRSCSELLPKRES